MKNEQLTTEIRSIYEEMLSLVNKYGKHFEKKPKLKEIIDHLPEVGKILFEKNNIGKMDVAKQDMEFSQKEIIECPAAIIGIKVSDSNSSTVILEEKINLFNSSQKFIFSINNMQFRSLKIVVLLTDSTKKEWEYSIDTMFCVGNVELTVISGNMQTHKITKVIDYTITALKLSNKGKELCVKKLTFPPTAKIYYVFKGSEYHFTGECEISVLDSEQNKFIEVGQTTKLNSLEDIEVVLTYTNSNAENEKIAFYENEPSEKIKNASDLEHRYEALYVLLETLAKDVDQYFFKNKLNYLNSVGFAYGLAYRKFETALKESEQAQTSINTFTANVFSVISMGFLSYISNIAASASVVKRLSDMARKVNISEDIVQAITDKVITFNPEAELPTTNDSILLPESFQEMVRSHLIAVGNDITNVMNNHSWEIAKKRIQLLKGQSINVEEEWNKFKKYESELLTVLKGIEKLNIAPFVKVSFSDLAIKYEKAIWSAWLPSLYRYSYTISEIPMYETGIGSVDSGIIAAMDRLGLLTETKAVFPNHIYTGRSEWQEPIRKLANWAKSYKIEPFVI